MNSVARGGEGRVPKQSARQASMQMRYDGATHGMWHVAGSHVREHCKAQSNDFQLCFEKASASELCGLTMMTAFV